MYFTTPPPFPAYRYPIIHPSKVQFKRHPFHKTLPISSFSTRINSSACVQTTNDIYLTVILFILDICEMKYGVIGKCGLWNQVKLDSNSDSMTEADH